MTEDPIDTIREALEAQHPENHPWQAALTELESVIDGLNASNEALEQQLDGAVFLRNCADARAVAAETALAEARAALAQWRRRAEEAEVVYRQTDSARMAAERRAAQYESALTQTHRDQDIAMEYTDELGRRANDAAALGTQYRRALALIATRSFTAALDAREMRDIARAALDRHTRGQT
jgi:chromosome segregation ATPase